MAWKVLQKIHVVRLFIYTDIIKQKLFLNELISETTNSNFLLKSSFIEKIHKIYNISLWHTGVKQQSKMFATIPEHSPVCNLISSIYTPFRYTVMAGTPQKMLEHLLETRLDGRGTMRGGDHFISSSSDSFLDDFLLTHIVFLPTHQLVEELDR